MSAGNLRSKTTEIASSFLTNRNMNKSMYELLSNYGTVYYFHLPYNLVISVILIFFITITNIERKRKKEGGREGA